MARMPLGREIWTALKNRRPPALINRHWLIIGMLLEEHSGSWFLAEIYWLNQLRFVYPRLVYLGAHWKAFHASCGKGSQERSQLGGVSALIQPTALGFRREDDGHAIVYGGYKFVCGSRDDRAGGYRDFIFLPHVPNAGKRKVRFIRHLKVMRLPGAALSLPFIETIRWNQAPSSQERLIETGFLLECFRSRIDKSAGLEAPGGNDAPAH